MKRFQFFLLLSIIHISLFSQNISVKSFCQVDNDLDAQLNGEIDRSNGEKAALIKIITTETGFEFGGGQLGIVKVVYKTAEVWVYVPAKLKTITISHPKLGQLPNKYYNFNIPIVSGKVYLMELVTGTVETTVKPIEIATQWLAINSTPQGANVFIKEQLVGTTPFSRKYPEGEYSYRLELPRYNSQMGKVSLISEKKVLDLVLKPHFGSLRITSIPENGMMVYLDDENTGKTTPATIDGISSGEHTLKVMNQWFQPVSKKVTVSDELTTTADFTMTPAFADITVTTSPAADILIDGKKVGNRTYTSRMLAGIYTIKAEKEKHNPDQKQITVVVGGKQTIALAPKPMNGTLDIASTPFDAVITINGKDYGTTPNTIKNLLVGDYTLTLKKAGYGTVTKTVTITENSTVEVNETLSNGMEVKIAKYKCLNDNKNNSIICAMGSGDNKVILLVDAIFCLCSDLQDRIEKIINRYTNDSIMVKNSSVIVKNSKEFARKIINQPFGPEGLVKAVCDNYDYENNKKYERLIRISSRNVSENKNFDMLEYFESIELKPKLLNKSYLCFNKDTIFSNLSLSKENTEKVMSTLECDKIYTRLAKFLTDNQMEISYNPQNNTLQICWDLDKSLHDFKKDKSLTNEEIKQRKKLEEEFNKLFPN